MSKKSAGLFGSKPDLLLVDERPPGIQLPSLDAAPPAPLEEEEEDEQVDFTDEDDTLEDDDSYDGDGPLRIFIGAPKKEGEPEKPAASVAELAPGPVWDASALAAGDEFDDDVEDTPDDAARGPILVRPDKAPAEPPPLTMSFGGSFSRGSMDAGVMDGEGEVIGGDLPRRDTVVVHDQIYDRFLSLDEPAAPPVRAHEDAGDVESADELLAVGAADEDEALPAGEAEDTIDMPSSVEDGPPPTRLRVGFVPGEGDEDDPSFQDEGLPVGARDPFHLDDEDEDEDDSYSASIAVGDPAEDAGESPSKIGALLGLDDHDLPEAPSLDGIPAIGSDAVPTLPEDPVERSAPRTEITEAVAAAAQDDWAARRRAAQQAMALPEPEAPAPEEEGGRAGTWIVVIFVAVILAIAAAWAWQQSQQPAPPPPPADTPTQLTPGSDAGPSPEGPAGDGPGEGVGTEPPSGDATEPPATDAEPTAAPADAGAGPADAPAPGADAMPAEGSVDAALGGDDQPTGVLRIRSSRSARVYVDGEYLGQTPMAAIDLPGGTHEIRVIAIDSGRTRTQTVRVDVGRSQEVRFSF